MVKLDLQGRVALVTGGSRGIGSAIARKLLDEGCTLAINARSEASLASARDSLPGEWMAVVGDVTDPTQALAVVQAVVKRFGRLDVLIANVGSGASVPPGRETAAEWQRVFALNLWSSTNMVEAARHALAQSRGNVVCISSICGNGVIPGAPITYSVAKAALNAYVASAARPLGDDGVRINAIAPGNILFQGSVWQRKLGEDAASVEAMLNREVPLARLGTPEEVADLAAYLASPRSAFATGSVWTLDGGQTR